MKTKHIIWIALLFIVLVFVLVVATFDQPVVSAQNLGAASHFSANHPHPAAEGVSEIGSTDGICYYGLCYCIDRDLACSSFTEKRTEIKIGKQKIPQVYKACGIF